MACLLVLVVAGIVGTTARSVLALESIAMEADGVDAGADATVQQAMSLDCPPNVVAELNGLTCDTEADMPAQPRGCPMMMNACVNMGSAAGHCGLVSVTESSPVSDSCASVVPVVFMQSAVLGSGRVADPIFHPPIL